jgi:hypothetical protein
MDEDGVNRDGLHYRAGYVEGLRALAQRVGVESVRAARGEAKGLEKAHAIAREMYLAMIVKMKGG